MTSPELIADDSRRIAAELHDLIAHQATIVSIQASAARSLAATNPHEAVNALAVVRTTATEALDDVRRLRRVLEEGDGGS
jgi:signal transduction histidine kinase